MNNTYEWIYYYILKYKDLNFFFINEKSAKKYIIIKYIFILIVDKKRTFWLF